MAALLQAPSALASTRTLAASPSPARPAAASLRAAGSLGVAAPLRSLRSSRAASSARPSRSFKCEATETAAAGAVTDATFKELVLDAEVPVLVDFWAPWCGPCRMIAPLIDELAVQYAGKIRCVKLNTDDSPGVATEYGIRSIPTVMIFKNGKKVDTVIGAVPKSTLTSTIDKYL